MQSQTLQPRGESYPDVDEVDLAHLAGVIDASGTVTVHISKNDKYSIGYQYQPVIRMIRPKGDDLLMGKILAYCDERGVKYSLSEKAARKEKAKKSNVWMVKSPESIRRFLEPLVPYLVAHYERAIVMLEEIVPRIEDDKHTEKGGFLELMEYADQIRGANRKGPETKYTKEYFEDEWSLTQ